MNYFTQALATIAALLFVATTHANSVSFDNSDYIYQNGQIIVTVNYDFTGFAMFGGGIDLFYNPDQLEFVSYTRADLSNSDAQDQASPIGELIQPGSYLGFGIGTIDYINGMTSAGTVGVFVFDAIGDNIGSPQCGGFSLCLMPSVPNPMVSLAGADVSDDVFSSGTVAYAYQEMPLPGAAWLLLSSVSLLGFLRRKNN